MWDQPSSTMTQHYALVESLFRKVCHPPLWNSKVNSGNNCVSVYMHEKPPPFIHTFSRKQRKLPRCVNKAPLCAGLHSRSDNVACLPRWPLPAAPGGTYRHLDDAVAEERRVFSKYFDGRMNIFDWQPASFYFLNMFLLSSALTAEHANDAARTPSGVREKPRVNGQLWGRVVHCSKVGQAHQHPHLHIYEWFVFWNWMTVCLCFNC